MKHFSEAREKLQSAKSTRNKRSTATKSPHLSQDERSSIGKMYTLNNSLKDASKDLSLEFRSIVPAEMDLPVALSQGASIDTKSIENALKTIGWTDEAIKTQKNRGKTQFFSVKGWGDWKGNPFKPFYKNEQEFADDIRTLQKNASNAYRQQQDLLRNQGRAVQRFRFAPIYSTLQSQYAENERRIAAMFASQDSHIVQKVANHLLKSMGQY